MANSWQSPVAGEPSTGSMHFTTSTGAWPDIARTEVNTAPYTWDLSGLTPVGTKAVLIFAQLLVTGTAAVEAFYGDIWDYDFGAFNVNEAIRRGLHIDMPYKPATGSAVWSFPDMCRWVKIGPSRKLYVGVSSAVTGRNFEADYCAYQM